MILTFKVKHQRDFSVQLLSAKKVADFGIATKTRSSKDVSQFGLPSAISNQILKKYRTAKKASKVNLTVPSQGIKAKGNGSLWVPCLKLEIFAKLPTYVVKVNQIELDSVYAHVSVTVPELSEYSPVKTLGIDCNTTGHCVVASCPETGKVLKLGKKAEHIHKSYKNTRHYFQKRKEFKEVKKVKHRESNIIRDLNHKMSRKVVREAYTSNAAIVLENLHGICKRAKVSKSFKGSLHSWSYYQFQTFVGYKAKLLGVPVFKVDPRYTSQQCSKCGLLGIRNGKEFRCSCGHVAHADVNASFVIALRHKGVLRLPVDKDAGKGSTDTPKRQRRRRRRP